MTHKTQYHGSLRSLKDDADHILRRFNTEMNPTEYVDAELAEYMRREYSGLVVPMGIVRRMVFSDVFNGKVRIHSEKVV